MSAPVDRAVIEECLLHAVDGISPIDDVNTNTQIFQLRMDSIDTIEMLMEFRGALEKRGLKVTSTETLEDLFFESAGKTGATVGKVVDGFHKGLSTFAEVQ